ncbi:deoxyribodipyrimidine photo-lyase (single-stranded DNA-specific) [Muriicola jejuensis]|uniref:Cryptochrome DASH n=1 Tax=Muriicola jejuensis TaxID=504488 RepID=A0A6P0U9N9_9FLAO|nr:DASH family cryptochrome [Muriicola jejuensis]NER09272.1 DASH family cryptochrome [Muriicola jejuensis]SMP09833.1 deoxyribodipyrimidine photo-lyase (single-stranded DNA-specific) [Muriicola jejuensis]
MRENDIEKKALIWFRNDLRTADNLSLTKACREAGVVAVYCIDPGLFEPGEYGFKRMEKFRARFLLESLGDLNKNLASLNISLLVYVKKAEEVIPEIVQKYGIQKVYLQKEWTRDELNELNGVRENTLKGIEFEESYDQFLFHPEDVPYREFAEIPEVFTQFRKACEKSTRVRQVLATPDPKPKTNLIPDTNPLPSLEDLGFEPFDTHPQSAFPFRGGENAAVMRIQEYFWETRKLAFYKKTRNGLVGKDYSSKLSPWLANGSLSAKTVYWEVKRFEKEIRKNQDTYWLIFELIWRDYFKYISLKYGDRIFHLGGILNKDYTWVNSEAARKEWIHGYTAEPFVNANMIELAQTGWMSNRGRQNVASYWAKELQQDWRIGASYFEAMLLDYDVHSNWGNWMYNSGVGNDPRDRKFNIQRQASQYDPHGTFQNRWLQTSLF